MEVYSWPFCGMTKCRGLCAGNDKIRFTMTYKSWIRWVGAALIALVLTVMPSVSPVHSVEDIRKVSVTSFGLFGDQGVFRNEATGAPQVVAGRFGSGPVNVQYNSKKGGGATIEALAMSLQVAANGMDAENDVLFLILTSHGTLRPEKAKSVTHVPGTEVSPMSRVNLCAARLFRILPLWAEWTKKRTKQVRILEIVA